MPNKANSTDIDFLKQKNINREGNYEIRGASYQGYTGDEKEYDLEVSYNATTGALQLTEDVLTSAKSYNLYFQDESGNYASVSMDVNDLGNAQNFDLSTTDLMLTDELKVIVEAITADFDTNGEYKIKYSFYIQGTTVVQKTNVVPAGVMLVTVNGTTATDGGTIAITPDAAVGDIREQNVVIKANSSDNLFIESIAVSLDGTQTNIDAKSFWIKGGEENSFLNVLFDTSSTGNKDALVIITPRGGSVLTFRIRLVVA